MSIGDLLRKWGDHWDGLHVGKDFAYVTRRSQIRSLAELAALGDVLSEDGDTVTYYVDSMERSLEEIEKIADFQLSEVAIMAKRGDTLGGVGERTYFRLTTTPQQLSGRTAVYGVLEIAPPPPNTIPRFNIERGVQTIKAAVRKKPWWRLRDFPVLNTATKATVKQQEHERRIRWQSFGLSIAASIVTAVLTTLVIKGMFPD